MSQSVQTLKQTVQLFFFSAVGCDVLFPKRKKKMYVQHYMNEGYLHCGILH